MYMKRKPKYKPYIVQDKRNDYQQYDSNTYVSKLA